MVGRKAQLSHHWPWRAACQLTGRSTEGPRGPLRACCRPRRGGALAARPTPAARSSDEPRENWERHARQTRRRPRSTRSGRAGGAPCVGAVRAPRAPGGRQLAICDVGDGN
ncbi:hypothetical protein GQ55_3G328500 [Panicum hallii var. hallii]|uniref:Uncharacterized protein n=1 Tax=Panicum hallii var. hallii TaxID=1504633 RepID=A0A2T7EFH7_9POAL|nr:hypothetical protein GQ55_3G328500 [Panicum hallii var. hallii]